MSAPSTPAIFSVLALFGAAALSGCAASPAARAGLRPTAPATAESSGPRSPYGLILAGQAAIGEGASRDAAVYFGRASALLPDAPSVRNRAFSAAILAGDVPRAAAAAPLAGEGTPAIQALARLVRATEALAQGQGKAAETELADTAVAAPHREAAALLRPWTNVAAGDPPKFAAAADLDGAALKTFAALGRAQLLERAGRHAEAEAVFKSDLNDRSGVFALGYGAFLERRGRGPEAVAVYDKVLAKAPGDTVFLTARARAAARGGAPPPPTVRQGAAQALIGPAALMLSQREAEVGVTYLRLALRLDPSLSEAWLLVGDAMTAAGDADAAGAAYRQIAAAAPEYPAAQGRLALALSSAGDKAGALALARRTAAAAPQDAQAQLILTELLRDNEMWGEAVQVLDRLIAQSGPKADWRLYYLRGASQERGGRWDAAQTDLQRALSLKPDEPEILNYLGYAWADRGERLPEALAMLQKATELQPNSGAIVDSLGWARYRLRDYPAAVTALEKAASLDPSDPEVNLHLGDAYWSTGRRLEAQFQWKRVLTLEPDARVRGLVEARLTGGGPTPAPAPPTAQR